MKCEHAGELYAIYAPSNETKNGTEWFGEPSFPLQCSKMVYEKGKTFKAHKHILNPRIIKRTQEAFVVIKGRIGVGILSEDKEPIGDFELGPGDMILIYKGYHAIKVLEDCVVYEIKSGQYDGYLSEEKEFLDVREK